MAININILESEAWITEMCDGIKQKKRPGNRNAFFIRCNKRLLSYYCERNFNFHFFV